MKYINTTMVVSGVAAAVATVVVAMVAQKFLPSTGIGGTIKSVATQAAS